MLKILLCCIALSAFASYPAHWWKHVPEDELASWEIAPQEAGEGEVILSKRTELGVFSNFSNSPFILDDVYYESVEGLWQGMKYPEVALGDKDPRNSYSGYPMTREEVFLKSSFEAKDLGTVAGKIMKKHGFKMVSYHGEFIDYKDYAEGSQRHYEIIYKAIEAKVTQNSEIKDLLIQTKGLKLRPDHGQGDNPPPSYLYHEILMDIRSKL